METAERVTDMIVGQPTSDILGDFNDKPAAIHNFQGDPMEIWKLTAFATGPSCGEGKKIIGQSFALTHWFAHEVELIQDDGEIIRAPRTVLFDESGNAWGFVSEMLFNSLRLMVQSIGPGPWENPPRVMIREGSGKGARTFYFLEPAPDRRVSEGAI